MPVKTSKISIQSQYYKLEGEMPAHILSHNASERACFTASETAESGHYANYSHSQMPGEKVALGCKGEKESDDSKKCVKRCDRLKEMKKCK